MLSFLSVPGASKRALISPPSYYRLAADSLMPPVVKLAKSRSAVIEDELDTVLRARAAGSSNDEIRALVRTLVAKRVELVGGNAA
ncbi:MAG: hypothetical protein KDH93_13390 [Rhodoferax sp.]|nr:hypothetical protein [Anaerolineae bacterium]MCB2006006.1 hypothetical protein [Rhodoferax sp.]